MDGGRLILILATTPGPNQKITNSSKKSVKAVIYTNSSEIGESMSPLWYVRYFRGPEAAGGGGYRTRYCRQFGGRKFRSVYSYEYSYCTVLFCTFTLVSLYVSDLPNVTKYRTVLVALLLYEYSTAVIAVP